MKSLEEYMQVYVCHLVMCCRGVISYQMTTATETSLKLYRQPLKSTRLCQDFNFEIKNVIMKL